MSDFELGLARDLCERSGERVESILEDLQAMTEVQRVPDDARHLIRMVLHDLKSVQRLLERHEPARQVAEDAS